MTADHALAADATAAPHDGGLSRESGGSSVNGNNVRYNEAGTFMREASGRSGCMGRPRCVLSGRAACLRHGAPKGARLRVLHALAGSPSTQRRARASRVRDALARSTRKTAADTHTRTPHARCRSAHRRAHI
jgi:hypothetical protein